VASAFSGEDAIAGRGRVRICPVATVVRRFSLSASQITRPLFEGYVAFMLYSPFHTNSMAGAIGEGDICDGRAVV
jgi:hypothetical protein